jgi:uncharacterized protein YebE (UPF0316 family)
MSNVDLLFAAPIGALLIFLCRIVDVSCDTLRVLFAIRGKRGIAGALGFVQALVWIFAVGNAVKHLDSPLHILGYAGGFAVGTFVGITIEQLLAYGLAQLRVVSAHGGVEIAQALRDRGFGVTEFAGFGREGTVEVVSTVVKRAHIADVMQIVDRFDPQAFVTTAEPQILRGGTFTERARRVRRMPLAEPIGRVRRKTARLRLRPRSKQPSAA